METCCKDVTVTLYLHSNLVTELLPLVLPIFLHPDPRISLDMTSYSGTEDGGSSTVTVCTVLGNVVAMTMGGPEVTTSDISTSFMLTDGTNASKLVSYNNHPLPLPLINSYHVVSQRTNFLSLDLSKFKFSHVCL